jgi:hypothetical protein
MLGERLFTPYTLGLYPKEVPLNFLGLLLLTPAAFAAPTYPVPGGATRTAVECTTLETVKVKVGEHKLICRQ